MQFALRPETHSNVEIPPFLSFLAEVEIHQAESSSTSSSEEEGEDKEEKTEERKSDSDQSKEDVKTEESE